MDMSEEKNIPKETLEKCESILGTEYVQQYLFAERVIPRKCTKAEKVLRLATIRRLVVAGVSIKEVCDYCEHRFEITPKQVHKYLTEIYQEFKKIGERDAEVNYGLAVERLEAALVECIRAGDMDNRIKVLKEIHDVQSIKKFTLDLTSKGERISVIVGGDFVGRPAGQLSQSPA